MTGLCRRLGLNPALTVVALIVAGTAKRCAICGRSCATNNVARVDRIASIEK